MSALSAPVSRDVVKPFWRAFRSANPEVKDRRGIIRIFAFAGGSVCGITGLLLFFGGIGSLITSGGQDLSNDIGMVLVGLMSIAGGVILVWALGRTRSQRTSPMEHYRLAQFAAANNMQYLPGPYLGNHIKPWAGRVIRLQMSRVLRTHTEPSVEFGNFEERYTQDDQRGTGFGGYAAIRLNTHLPNILLLSRLNATGTDIWRTIPVRSEKISLEGDFDNYFTLYAPAGYDADALYLFTPDIMANLMDKVAPFDVEIIDDWVLLTTRHDAVTTDPATWATLVTAVAAITAKFDQWQRWTDDRIESSTSNDVGRASLVSSPPETIPDQTKGRQVAPQGRRLRLGRTRGSLLTVGICLVVMAMLLALPDSPLRRGTSAGSASSNWATAAHPAPGTTPAWANPATVSGTQITTFSAGGVRVDVYQVATFSADGETMVLFDFVATNDGPPLNVNAAVDCFSVDQQYVDVPPRDTYATTESFYSSFGLNAYSVHPGGPASAIFATGDVLSVGKALPYVPGATIEFRAFIWGESGVTIERGTGQVVLG